MTNQKQDQNKGTRGGSSEQHAKAGRQSHKNDNKSSSSSSSSRKE
jgi:hypothetical protein